MKCLRSKKRNYASDYTTIEYTITHCIFIDVPTNPGPRSFCAQPVRWCRHPRAYPTIPQLLYLREATPFPKFTNPYPIIPRSQIPRPRNVISDKRPQSTYGRVLKRRTTRTAHGPRKPTIAIDMGPQADLTGQWHTPTIGVVHRTTGDARHPCTRMYTRG